MVFIFLTLAFVGVPGCMLMYFVLMFIVAAVVVVFFTYIYCVVVFFTLTDRASTKPGNIRGCQSGTWSAEQKNIKGTSTKLQ